MISCVTLILALLGGSATRDACATRLPAALKAMVTRQFPGYHLPKQSDNLAEDVRFNMEQGGDGCLGVATGDFSGDSRKDFAFLLTSKAKVWLVVATAQGKSWILEKIWEVGDADYRMRLYVDSAPPGKYDDLGLSDELEPGQVTTMTTEHEVVVSGLTESSGVAFTKTANGWVHVWIAD